MFLLTSVIMAIIGAIFTLGAALANFSADGSRANCTKAALKDLQTKENDWLQSASCPLKKSGNIFIGTYNKRKPILTNHYIWRGLGDKVTVVYGYDKDKHEYGLVDEYSSLIFSISDINHWYCDKGKSAVWNIKKEYDGRNYYERAYCSNCGKNGYDTCHWCNNCGIKMVARIYEDGYRENIR